MQLSLISCVTNIMFYVSPASGTIGWKECLFFRVDECNYVYDKVANKFFDVATLSQKTIWNIIPRYIRVMSRNGILGWINAGHLYMQIDCDEQGIEHAHAQTTDSGCLVYYQLECTS